MKEIRFESVETKKVHIFGEDFECRKPSVFEQFEYEKELSGKSGDDIVPFVLSYIENLGLPKKAVMKLSSSDLVKLIEFITDSGDKKK